MNLESVFDSFANEAEAQLVRMREEIRSLRTELQPLHEEIRSLRTQLETRASVPLVGPVGPAGKDGAIGRDGVDGKDGRDGKDGDRGEKGERGADGMNGRDGLSGPQGERGERGADGIATREEIETIWDERHAVLQVRNLADSWRGVWSPSEKYQRGNVAQWDGSPWLALTDRPATKPGTSSDWVLFAKKGRDGRK